MARYGLMGASDDAVNNASKYLDDYAAGNLPPEALPAVAAAKVIVNGGSAEDAANAAMQAACVGATGGAGAAACQLATVDNIVKVQNFVHGLLPSSWQAKGKMQCWFLDYKVVYAAEDIYGKLNALVAQSYADTRKAMGLPEKSVLREIIGSDGHTRRPLLPIYHDIVTKHTKWSSTEVGTYYPYNRNLCRSGNIAFQCSGRKITLTPAKGPWAWSSSSPDDCGDTGVKDFNEVLMNLFTQSRLLAAKESIKPALKAITQELETEAKAANKSSFKIPRLPTTDKYKNAKIALAIAIAAGALGLAMWEPKR